MFSILDSFLIILSKSIITIVFTWMDVTNSNITKESLKEWCSLCYFFFIAKQTCSVEWIVVQRDGAEGKLHGSTCYPLIDNCKGKQRAESEHNIKSCFLRSK